ncbi:hypothetical protein DACRYDRAFT_73335 [Dacryopinax primogenitus]|uniref:Ubiquitin-like domain-containing protein n=1 Tax=Dacryopinax primogenitus (strain DJM 731) TaxID=1858805 RepID=M5GAY3_DACPD|nr:uncharacterized protein DACRYDRAFT_73335 [Dacryopinax primogenitus]EJU06064.1 hypothetical protein DACRYDRAFT_73335 [Dacryopinax primogenitus]
MASIPMSEKARGKQRAPLEELQNQAPRNRPITIRFTEGVPDLTLRIQEHDAIRDIKKQIREYRPQLKNRRLRLIYLGRLLTDGIIFYDWLATLEERQRRAAPQAFATELREVLVDGAASTDLKGKGRQKSKDAKDEEITWLHCSIGAEMEVDGEEERAQTAQIAPLRGFDRLANAGFTPEDIEVMRRQFYASRGETLESEDREGDDAEEHARALEEQWIDDIDNQVAAADPFSDGAEGEGVYMTTLQGLLTGFFFPLMPFYFMRQPPPPTMFTERELNPDTPFPDLVPTVIFSRRMQVAIILGLVANISYAFLRMFH